MRHDTHIEKKTRESLFDTHSEREWRVQLRVRRAFVRETDHRRCVAVAQNAFADYLRYHRVQFELEEMVNDVLIDKPANPFEVLAKLLKEKSATYDVPEAPKKKSAGNASKKKVTTTTLTTTLTPSPFTCCCLSLLVCSLACGLWVFCAVGV